MCEEFEILAQEYISKCNCCDECFAEYFCIENQRRDGRNPCNDRTKCVKNIFDYLKSTLNKR